MSMLIKITAIHGKVWHITTTNSKIALKNGMQLTLKDKLLLSQHADVILQLPNYQLIQIKGSDLIDKNGIFSLATLDAILVDAETILNLTTQPFKYLAVQSSDEHTVLLENGDVLQKKQLEHVDELLKMSEITQSGYRFVQLARLQQDLVSDGITPFTVRNIIQSIRPFHFELPEKTPDFINKNLYEDQWSNLYSNVTSHTTTPLITAIVNLSASSQIESHTAYYIFTATLSHASQGITTIVTSQGTIYITDGQTTGSISIAANNGEDVYLDGSQLTATIDSVSGGNFENIIIDNASATASITDSIDTTIVTLSDTTIMENQNITITATVAHAVQDTDLIIILNNAQIITILVGQTTGSVTFANTNPTALTQQFYITNAVGGGYESLNTDDTALITIGHSPVTNDQHQTTNEDNALNGQITASDIDGDILGYTVTTAPSHGTVVLNSATGGYIYTPTTDYNGADSFVVTVSDGNGDTTTSMVNISVQPVADTAILRTDTGTVKEDSSTLSSSSGTLTIFDPDAGEQFFVAQANTATTYGSFSINTAGEWVYNLDNNKPDIQALKEGETLTETINVYSVDGTSTNVTITITGTNDVPTAQAVTASGNEDAASILVTLNAADIDGTIVSYTIETLPSNGLLYSDSTLSQVITANSTITNNTVYFVPAANWHGQTTFNYHATD
ncbi:MAG: hypothetical protein E6Q25_06005, partial [Acinetobacter sp.]